MQASLPLEMPIAREREADGVQVWSRCPGRDKTGQEMVGRHLLAEDIQV